jgi:cell wall-associated NlpC family hydrolase
MRVPALVLLFLSALLIVACTGVAPRSPDAAETIAQASPAVSGKGNEVVFYALGLLDTGYRFGGKNPEAGVDCSGMVSHIYDRAVGLKVQGSAADIARRGRSIGRADLRPGDLVFFNTLNRPLSHVGIYIGDARFIHAPSSSGKVRIDRLGDSYFARRFETARTYFD